MIFCNSRHSRTTNMRALYWVICEAEMAAYESVRSHLLHIRSVLSTVRRDRLSVVTRFVYENSKMRHEQILLAGSASPKRPITLLQSSNIGESEKAFRPAIFDDKNLGEGSTAFCIKLDRITDPDTMGYHSMDGTPNAISCFEDTQFYEASSINRVLGPQQRHSMVHDCSRLCLHGSVRSDPGFVCSR